MYIKDLNGNYRTEKYNNRNCKNFLNELHSRMEMTENGIIQLEYKVIKFIQCKRQKNHLGKNKQSLKDLWDRNPYSNICIIRVLEGEETQNRSE